MRQLCSLLAGLSVLALVGVTAAETIQGSYIEARTAPPASCDSATSGGQHSQAVLAWQVREGAYDGQKLDGQTIIAVVTGDPSPGTDFGRTKTVFFIDSRTSSEVQHALVHLAKDLAPTAIHDAGELVKANVDVRIAEGCGCGAAVVECPLAKLRTRRLTDADQALLGEHKNEKPLGEVFSSSQTFADQWSFAGEPAANAGAAVTAFAGSFSR